MSPPNKTPATIEESIEPRIIPRAEHPISRKNIDREALKVLYRLRDAGHTAYLVGGGVRDLYLRKTPKDFDISTDARPGQLRKLFKNSRLIGRRFRLVQVFFPGGKIIEVSTFRCRSEYDITTGKTDQQAVLAANNTFGSPMEDAFRRDLTINALFYEIENFSIIDYTGGVKDLDEGIIRVIGDPDLRFTRDPARMLRVIRHAARNDFTIEANTWQAITRHRGELTVCPVSRVRDELFKDLRSGAGRRWAELALKCGLFSVIFPCYEDILCRGDKAHPRDLLALFGVNDRLQGKGITLPHHLILAMLLLPWAVDKLDILNQRHKGAAANRFTKELRRELDTPLNPLGIKRADKEAITTLLRNLPQFHLYHQQDSWPRWLKRKSYYRECDLFYRLYRESTGDKPVKNSLFAGIEKTTEPQGKRPPKKRSGRRRRPKRGAAFAGRKQGSIFGLDK